MSPSLALASSAKRMRGSCLLALAELPGMPLPRSERIALRWVHLTSPGGIMHGA